MAGIQGAVEWAGKHPVPVAMGVFAVGAIILLMMRPTSSGDNGMSAFYAAQSAQAASGNSLMAVQDTNKTQVALADIAGQYGVQVNTIRAQTDVSLAGINADVLNNQELTRQQAQRQQFFLGAGQQGIEAAAFPYFLRNFSSGDPVQAASALDAWKALAASATAYNPAH